jgi:uncharacterized membrane protein YvbJ
VISSKALKERIQTSLDKVKATDKAKSKPVTLSQTNEETETTIIVFGTLFQMDVAMKTAILIAVLLVILAVVGVLFYFCCYRTTANAARE